MVKYQAYFAGPDGRFASHRVFACYTDEQAIEWRRQLMDPARPGRASLRRASYNASLSARRRPNQCGMGELRDFHDETA